MKKTILSLLVLFLPVLIVAQDDQNSPKRPIVFRNVTLIDMQSDQAQPGMTVIVSGHRISAIGKNIKIPKNAEVIEASGKFLIPGLWDMHTHAVSTNGRTRRFWLLFRAHGVVGTREMGNDLESLRLGREEARKFFGIAPRIVWSSPMLDGVPPTFEGSAIAIADEKEARRQVREMKAAGFDFLKIYNGLSREAFFGVADESRRVRIAIAGEVPDAVSPSEAARAGMRSFEHLWNLFESCVSGAAEPRDALRRLERENAAIDEKRKVQDLRDQLWLTAYDARCADRLVADLRRTKTFQTPTLAINRNYSYLDEEPNRADTRRRWIPAKFLAYWDELRAETLAGYGTESRAAWRFRYKNETELVRRFQKAGIKILAGSDVTDWEPFIYPGASLHDELALLVEAGLTPFEALQTATVNPAKFLGREKERGTIEKGKFADLVLLDANPLENIANTKNIAAVVFDGKYYSKTDLENLLNEAETLAAAQKN